MTVRGVLYFIGARDVAHNDRFVWKGNREVLPDNSALWKSHEPDHGSADCVSLYEADGKLHDVLCSTTRRYICEVA